MLRAQGWSCWAHKGSGTSNAGVWGQDWFFISSKIEFLNRSSAVRIAYRTSPPFVYQAPNGLVDAYHLLTIPSGSHMSGTNSVRYGAPIRVTVSRELAKFLEHFHYTVVIRSHRRIDVPLIARSPKKRAAPPFAGWCLFPYFKQWASPLTYGNETLGWYGPRYDRS